MFKTVSHLLRSLIVAAVLVTAILAGSVSRASAVNYGNLMFKGGEHVEYTRVIKRADGSLLAAFNVRYAVNQAAIRFYRSTDNGNSFSFLTELFDVAEPGRCIGTETIIELPSGTILLGYVVWDDNNQQSGEKLKIWKSTNGGSLWSFVTTIENGLWAWEPEFAFSTDGALQVYYSFSSVLAWNSIFLQNIVRRESTDGGATWSDRITAVGDANNHVGMPRIVKVSANLYYIAFEYYEDSGAVHLMASSNGKTWDGVFGKGAGSRTMEIGYAYPDSGGWMFSTPAITYVNGALIGIGKEYKTHLWGDMPNNGQVVLYSKDAGHTWHEMATPFTISYTGDDHDNWSPTLLPLSNSQLFLISPTGVSGRPTEIRYGTGAISTP